MSQLFTDMVIEIIQSIPYGRVCSYGKIAAMADNPQAARQVVRVLHSSSEREKLPWWRVVNSHGTISLKPGSGYEEQRNLLESEGVEFDFNDRIDFKQYGWTDRE